MEKDEVSLPGWGKPGLVANVFGLPGSELRKIKAKDKKAQRHKRKI
jgi:hypothetical protein